MFRLKPAQAGFLVSGVHADVRRGRLPRVLASRRRGGSLRAFGPGGETGRRKGLKICFVKSFLLELPSQKVNSDNGLRASEL